MLGVFYEYTKEYKHNECFLIKDKTNLQKYVQNKTVKVESGKKLLYLADWKFKIIALRFT